MDVLYEASELLDKVLGMTGGACDVQGIVSLRETQRLPYIEHIEGGIAGLDGVEGVDKQWGSLAEA